MMFRLHCAVVLFPALSMLSGCGGAKKPENTVKAQNVLKPLNVAGNSSAIVSLTPMNQPGSANAVPVTVSEGP